MYLLELSATLIQGAGRIDRSMVSTHGDYLLSLRNTDGGFPDRAGVSDLYYTGFALRGLAMLDRLDERAIEPTAGYLQSQVERFQEMDSDRALSSIDAFSLVTAALLVEAIGGVDVFQQAGVDLQQTYLDFIAQRWRDDEGGYAKTSRGRVSTYHTFLTLAAREMIDQPPTPQECDMIERMLSERQQESGGFAELAAIRRAATNPTAAAIGTLKMIGRLDDDRVARIGDYLATRQTGSGGFLAADGAPFPDLLSTATALIGLWDLGGLDKIDVDAASRFVSQTQCQQGGFLAGEWEDTPDAEYTFYGLAAQSLLAAI